MPLSWKQKLAQAHGALPAPAGGPAAPAPAKKRKKRVYRQPPMPKGEASRWHDDGRLTLVLPLPHPRLSPNGSHGHWRGKAQHKQEHRDRAHFRTREAIGARASGPVRRSARELPVFTGYKLDFFWPNLIPRDDDNAAASCKAYRDGIADALHMDDNRLPMAGTPTFHLDRENPRLEITLLP